MTPPAGSSTAPSCRPRPRSRRVPQERATQCPPDPAPLERSYDMQFLHRDAWPQWARGVTSPWLISPLLVVALAVGGFTAYGAWTRAHPTHYARGGDAFGVDSLLTSPSASPSGVNGKVSRNGKKPPAGATGKKKVAAAATGRHATGAGGSGSTAGGSPSGGSTSRGSTSGGSTSSSGPSGPGLPAPGAY